MFISCTGKHCSPESHCVIRTLNATVRKAFIHKEQIKHLLHYSLTASKVVISIRDFFLLAGLWNLE